MVNGWQQWGMFWGILWIWTPHGRETFVCLKKKKKLIANCACMQILLGVNKTVHCEQMKSFLGTNWHNQTPTKCVLSLQFVLSYLCTVIQLINFIVCFFRHSVLLNPQTPNPAMCNTVFHMSSSTTVFSANSIR